jgi:hypothetical protein
VRQYVIERVAPDAVACILRRLDGSIEPIPMRITTIDEMVRSGLQPDYWRESKRRQRQHVASVERAIENVRNDRPHGLEGKGLPTDLIGWSHLLVRARRGRTIVDHDGYRRTPGTQLRGHLSHRCLRHSNQTSTSLSPPLAIDPWCGCQHTQITVGERREHGVTHSRCEYLCPIHESVGFLAYLEECEQRMQRVA